MPIKKVYRPDATLAGQVAHQAGLGQFRQRQDQFTLGADQFDQQQALREQQFGLQQQQLDERQRQFDQQLQFQAEKAALDQFNRQQAVNLQQQQGELNRRARFQAQQNSIEAQFGMEQLRQTGRANLEQQRWDALQQDHAAQAEARFVTEQLKGQWDQFGKEQEWNRESVDTLRKHVNDRIKGLQELELTDTARQHLGELASRNNALTNQAGKLRSGQLGHELEDILEELERSGFEDKTVKPPTIQDEFFGVDENGEPDMGSPFAIMHKENGWINGPGVLQISDTHIAHLDKDGVVKYEKFREEEKAPDEGKIQKDRESQYKAAEDRLQKRWQADPKNTELTEKEFDSFVVYKEIEQHKENLQLIEDIRSGGLSAVKMGFLDARSQGKVVEATTNAEIRALSDGTYFTRDGKNYLYLNGQAIEVQ